MELMSFESVKHSYSLATHLRERASDGLDIVLGPTDMELASLGLFALVLLSGHLRETFEGIEERD